MTTLVNEKYLRTGAEYRAGLRDGRRVWLRGGYVEDVAVHPAFMPAVDRIAAYFDAENEGPYRDVLTELRPDGTRVSSSFVIPRDQPALRRRRAVTEAIVEFTKGTMGRSPDFMPLFLVGLLAHRDIFEKSNPELAKNLDSYLARATETEPVLAWGFVHPQSDKRLPMGESGDLTVVEKRASGIIVSGAKTVATLAPVAEEIMVSTLPRPNLQPENAIWCTIPLNSPGVTVVCREPLAMPATETEHPLRSIVDEIDALVMFEKVFVPWERVFNIGDVELPRQYLRLAAWSHWGVFTRLARRMEIVAGAASLIPQAIGTSDIPQVRDLVAEVLRYLETLRAFVTASEADNLYIGGIAAPNRNTVTVGRLYAVEHYPRIMNILQELSGQGLIMRFAEADFSSPDVGPALERTLRGKDISARDKSRLFNLVWDLTSDSIAGRNSLFEQFNALSVPTLRQVFLSGYDPERLKSIERQAGAAAEMSGSTPSDRASSGSERPQPNASERGTAVTSAVQQTGAPTPPPPQLIEVAKRVFAFIGPMGNSNTGFVVGDRGVLLIDTRINPFTARQLEAAVKSVTEKPITHVVNTHFHGDHTFGNQVFAPTATIIGSAVTRERLIREGQQHLEWLGQFFKVDYSGVTITPPDIGFQGHMSIDLGGTSVDLIESAGHTAGDVLVYVREAKALFTGDVLVVNQVPWLGHSPGTAKLAQSLIDLSKMDTETLVPGHGFNFTVGKRKDTFGFLQFVLDVRQQVMELVDQGVGLDQVQSKVDLTRYATWRMGDNKKWLDLNIEAIYRELAGDR